MYYSQEEIEKAVGDFEAAVEINPSYQQLRIWLAAAYAAAGRMDDARWQAQEILLLNPEFSVSHIEQVFPIQDPVYRERLLNDLRQAGLPE